MEELESLRDLESQAQYDAWMAGLGEPFDFTGASYLEEYARPLRELTPLMGRFSERLDEAWTSIIRGWCQWPTIDQAALELIAEIDQCIHDDGDYFLREDESFLDDDRKLELLAVGRELAVLSRDFWERLHWLGATPQMVREANHLLLLRECGEEVYEESGVYRDELVEAILDYHPTVEAARNNGRDFFDALKDEIVKPGIGPGLWSLYGYLQESSIGDLKVALAACVRRDGAGVSRFLDRLSAKEAAEARKRNWRSHRQYVVQRTSSSAPSPWCYADTSFLTIRTVDQAVSQAGHLILSQVSVPLARRRTGARSRSSRGGSSRAKGSRRITSRSAGGGSSGDDPDPEPSAQWGAPGLESRAVFSALDRTAADRTLRDIAVTSFGAMVGDAAIGLKGMLIGGAVAYLWGRWRWPGNG